MYLRGLGIASCVVLRFPLQCVKVRLLFIRAAALVLVTPGKGCDQIAFLVLSILRVRWAVCIRVDEILRDHGEFREDRAVPSVGMLVCRSQARNCGMDVLDDMLERVELGLLEVVASVDWVEPDVQKVLCPLPIA
jgi:hypothetical protein